MAKTSAVEKNKRRRKLVAQQANKRAKLKAVIQDRELPIEERFKATLKLAEMPRNGSKTRPTAAGTDTASTAPRRGGRWPT